MLLVPIGDGIVTQIAMPNNVCVPRHTRKSQPTNCAYSSMPLQTRNIAKGVAPRLHLPKSTKPRPIANGGATKQSWTQKRRKRNASKSSDESKDSESSQSDDSEPQAKARKKRARRQATASEEEVEEVDADDEPPTEQIEVEDMNEEQPGLLDVVSMNGHMIQRVQQTHMTLG
jgi:hypothetical protein